MRASELLLIVRAQNQASGALRRVAGDLRGLSALGGLRQRGQSLQIARNQLQLSRQIAANELQSLTTGKRAQELSLRRQTAEMALGRAQLSRSNINQQMLRREAGVERNLATQSLQARRIRTAATPEMAREASKRLSAARTMGTVLANQEQLLARAAALADQNIGKQTARLKNLSAAEAEAAARADVLRSRIANYGDRLRLNTQQINDNNRAISRARWDRVAAGGRILQHSARVAQYAGLVLGGSLAAAANYAAKFDTSVTLAATQTRKAGASFLDTAKNSKVLQADIRSLMTEFPASADDFAKAAYDIYSSTSVSFAGGRKALKLFAQAAVAGMTDVQTATNMGITVLNNFKGGMADLPAKMQRSFAAVRFGRMSFEQFATSMSTIAPAARAANQSFDEMVGTFAFLTRHLDIAKARVGFARVLEALATPKMLIGLKGFGITIQDAQHHLLPLHEILGKIITRFPQLRRGGTDAMNFFKNIGGNQGTMQARRAFTFLVQFFDKAGKDGRSYLDMLKDVRNDNDEFTQSLRAMEKTTGVRWGVFINQLKALALAIGASVVPALLKIAGPIQDVIKWWRQLDEGTRNQIGRWATYAAAIMLVGGAFAFVSGTVIRLFAAFGRLLGFATGLGATFTVLALAAAALTGHIKALSDILDVIANFAFGSFTGFAVTMGIVAVSAVRLTAALKGLAGAEAVAGGGGILAGLFGRSRHAKTMFNLERMGGAGLGKSLAGAAAGAGLLSGSLLVAGGAIVAGVAGLALWKMHMASVRRDAEAIKAAQALGAAPRKQFDVFQQLPKGVEDVQRATINIRQMQRSLADLRKEAAGAEGRKRLELLDQIALQTLDLADAQRTLQESNARVNRQFDAYTAGLARFIPAAQRVRVLQRQLADLERIRARTPLTPGIDSIIEQTRRELHAVLSETRTGAINLERVFKGVVNQLSKMGQIPRVSGAAMRDMFNVSKQAGRMLTIPEMKAIIRAEVDPKARQKLPADIRAIFSRIRAQRIKVTIEQQEAKKQLEKDAKKARFIDLKQNVNYIVNAGRVKAERAKAAKILTPLHQKVVVDPPANLGAVGAAIVSGIQGYVSGHPITGRVVYQAVVEPFKKGLKARSPSLVMANEVGKPIMQGIIQGILSETGQLEKTATIVANIFGGKVLSTFDETKKKKITGAVLQKDLQSQLTEYRKFNNSLARLARRGVPKELIDQLASLGPDAAEKIALLSKMSGPELRKYVRLWRQTQAQVKRSMRTTVEDVRNATKQLKESIMNNLVSTFNQIRDTNVSNFGALFQGPTNLSSMVGDNYKQALEEYNNAAADFRSQIRDLNNQIADAHKEATQRLIDAIAQRRDELQSSMGQLFSGDWMQGAQVQTRLDWGKKLGFDDLQKDLQSQVDKFARWRKLLVEIAAKVPPELATQLEALGPEAVDKLEILNSGSSEQLAAYVALWQQGQTQIMAIANQTTVDTSDITARINDIVAQISDVSAKLAALQMPHELTAEDIINDLKAQQAQWIEYGNILQSLSDKGLPAELLQQLQQMGPEALPFLRAMNTMSEGQLAELAKTFHTNQELITKDTLKMLNNQLQLWFQYGQKIGIEIASGIDSTSPQLQAYFKNLIKSMLQGGGFSAAFGPIYGDTPPMGGPIIDPLGTGTEHGFTSYLTGAALVNPPADNRTFNMTVNQADGESLTAALERATFRLSNRR